MNNSLHKRLLKAGYKFNQTIGDRVDSNNEDKDRTRKFINKHTSNLNSLPILRNAQHANDHIEWPTSNMTTNTLSSTKFSANDRLKKYRDKLNHRKDEIVKVHQVFSASVSRNTSDEQKRLPYRSSSNTGSTSILGKRLSEQIKDKTGTDQEIVTKKRKISENSQQYEIKKDIERRKLAENIPQKEMCLEKNKILHLNTSIENICSYDDDCDMDWSPINQEEAVSSDLLSEEYGKNSKKFVAKCDHVVYVPWIVIQELDYFKDGRSGSPAMLKAARKAIKFVNDMLTRKHAKLKGI
ncbi:pin domain [Holotrichia oblita]|uniref:Pin domain n=1 Tax=Holotrichia oblita TaxID=644536 RepID=A0ACB9TUK6_HOLOL|nr:pin domain [Holotrichia oblita]